MTSDEDSVLLAEARAGSRLSLSRLIDRHQQAVRAFLRRVAVDREDADDLAQETFVTAWAQLAAWRGAVSAATTLLAQMAPSAMAAMVQPVSNAQGPSFT